MNNIQVSRAVLCTKLHNSSCYIHSFEAKKAVSLVYKEKCIPTMSQLIIWESELSLSCHSSNFVTYYGAFLGKHEASVQ